MNLLKRVSMFAGPATDEEDGSRLDDDENVNEEVPPSIPEYEPTPGSREQY